MDARGGQVKSITEARLLFYLRPAFEEAHEFAERRLSRGLAVRLLQCVRDLQDSPVIEIVGFREPDTFCKISDDEIMVEWLGGRRTFSLLVTPAACSAMLLSFDQDDSMVQHGQDGEIQALFEIFRVTEQA